MYHYNYLYRSNYRDCSVCSTSALDAHCLLAVYESLKSQALSIDPHFNTEPTLEWLNRYVVLLLTSHDQISALNPRPLFLIFPLNFHYFNVH